MSKVQIFTPADCLEDMLHDLKTGKEKGSTTHIPDLDQAWTWRKGEFNIWSGYSNEGKSLFLRYLCGIKAIKDDWKFLFSAPEDFPPKEFYDDLIHTVAGITTDNSNKNCITEEDYMKAFELIKKNFIFVYLEPPKNTIKNTLDEFAKIIEDHEIDACIIDPLIKFAKPDGMSDRDDQYASYITTLCTHFCRTNNISLHLVMHQLTPKMNNDGYYPKPNMYTIKGGGTWSDGTDNILTIQRPKYAKDKLDSEVVFTSQKIKKQKLVGIPQEFRMKFDRKKNRYMSFETGKDLFDFNSVMYPKRKGKIFHE